MAQQTKTDLERGAAYVTGIKQGYYLTHLAWVISRLGAPQRSLQLFERALALAEGQEQRLTKFVLNNMADVYHAIGQPQRALNLYEQALSIMQEVGDRYDEAVVLNDMAAAYQSIGQVQRALSLYEQALPIVREAGNRAGEAYMLNNMALVYQDADQLQRALSLHEQALPLMQEVGNRAGEAQVLANMATVYQTIGQLQHALSLYEQALPALRETGIRASEAQVLNGLAYLYLETGYYTRAETAFAQSLQLARFMNHPSFEVAGCIGLSFLLYGCFQRPAEAIHYLEQAIEVFTRTGLPQDAAGHTPEPVQTLLQTMRQGTTLSTLTSNSATMPVETIRRIVTTTVVAMTHAQEHQRDEWRESMEKSRQNVQSQGPDWQTAVDFFTSILAILDGQTPTLPDDHPYAQALAAILKGIAAGGAQEDAEQ
jgi:tetratricopeptide (TPR) repeat protein